MGCPYAAVGMQRALDSAIGLPRRSTSASWMLVFLMPRDVEELSRCSPGVRSLQARTSPERPSDREGLTQGVVPRNAPPQGGDRLSGCWL